MIIYRGGKSRSFIISNQRIIDINRNGNSANFFSHVCNDKKVKELFASTLDKKPISVRCVSSMTVVLNANFTHANKRRRTEEGRLQRHVLLAETRWRLTFITVFTAHAKTSQLYISQRSMQANKNINLRQKKAPVLRLSRSKAPKHS